MKPEMWTRPLLKVVVVAALAGAVVIARPEWPLWLTLVAIAFGAFNVLADAPGVAWSRGLAIGGTLAAIAVPEWLAGPVALIAWLLWVPAFAVAWVAAPRRAASEATRARLIVATLIVAVALAAIAYRVLVAQHLQQTAALFIGIPAILATAVLFGVSPTSATGVACKAVTIALLVSLLFLWEGMMCVVMSAPLFFAVAITISRLVQGDEADERGTITLRSCIVLLAVVPMSLEGVSPLTTIDREESVTASKFVAATPEAVGRALFDAPRFDRIRPLFLRGGFPSPIATRIERADGATRWMIRMRGGEMLLSGMEPRTGELTLELAESRPGMVRWRVIADTSHMTHFLNWREVVVRWQPADAGGTRVTWTLRYRRGLDPAWYFGPMERYASRLAAGYLIDSVATP
jgi:hypothetical protein